MLPFSYQRAADDRAAIDGGAAGARFLAGGTTLVDLMREHVERPAALVDINGLAHREVSVTDRAIEIGALARMSDVASHPGVAAACPAIVEALLASASAQLRNMASMGGNLLQRTRCTYFRDPGVPCNKREPGTGCPARTGLHRTLAIFGGSDHCIATHASDVAVALVAFDAVVHVRGRRGRRTVLLADLYRLPGLTPHVEHVLGPDELIVRITVPITPLTRRSHYLKVRDRVSYEFALVSAAVGLEVDGGVIRRACVAAGGVGTVPWRLRLVEDALAGRPDGADTWQTASARASEGARPLRQNAFKTALLTRTVVRAIEELGGAR